MSKNKKRRQGKKKEEQSRPKTPLGSALVAEQDRGCILVGAAYLEHGLYQLLSYHLNSQTQQRPWGDSTDADLIADILSATNPMALLKSGWAKSVIAFLLGLIDRMTYEAYDRIRNIRNECAHHPGEVILDEELLAGLMQVFEAYDKSSYEEIKNTTDNYLAGKESLWSELGGHNRFGAQRIRFMHACILIDARIMFRVMRYSVPDIKGYIVGFHHSKPNEVFAFQRYSDPNEPVPKQMTVHSAHVAPPIEHK
jgi:hypothetical protein